MPRNFLPSSWLRSLTRTRQKPRKPTRAPVRRFPLLLELLEDRTLPSASTDVLDVTTQPPATVLTGSPFSFAVQVDTAPGGPVDTTYTGKVSVAIAPGFGPAGAFLGGATPVPITNGTGVAQFNNLTVDQPGSSAVFPPTGYKLQVNADNLTSVTTTSFDAAQVAVKGIQFSNQGVDFSYSVSGASLPTSVPVSLYWARGSDYSDRISQLPTGTGVDFAWNTIPKGIDPQQNWYTHTIPGSILVGSPADAQDLLVVLGVGNPSSPSFNVPLNVKALPLDLSVPQVSQGVGDWAKVILGFSPNKTKISEGGCLLVSLDMALNYATQQTITDPLALNKELTNVGIPYAPGYFPGTGNVNLIAATGIAGRAASLPDLTFNFPSSPIINDAQKLRDLLTSTGAPVIVKVGNPHAQKGNVTAGSNLVTDLTDPSSLYVGEPVSGPDIPDNTTIAYLLPGTSKVLLSANANVTVSGAELTFYSSHFVLVTGPAGLTFNIKDPGDSDRTTLISYNNSFEVRGYVKDPPDESAMYVASISTGGDVGLSVTNAAGQTTGISSPGSTSSDQIPNSSYFEDGPLEGQSTDNTTVQYVYIDQPGSENYTITSTGTGDYTLDTGGESVSGQLTPATDFTASASSLETNHVTADSTNGQITVAQPTPEVNLTANGGVYSGSPFAATATITDANGHTGPTLEGVGLQLTYYTGTTISGAGSATAPTAAGTYTVVASFPGSTAYTSASDQATFTISPPAQTVPLQQALGSADTGLGNLGQSSATEGLITQSLGGSGVTLPLVNVTLDAALNLSTDLVTPLQTALGMFQGALSLPSGPTWSSLASDLKNAGFSIPLPFSGTPDANGNLFEVAWNQSLDLPTVPLLVNDATDVLNAGGLGLDVSGGGLFGGITASGQVSLSITFGVDVNAHNQLGFFVLPNANTVVATLTGATASDALSGSLAIGDLANVSVTAGANLNITGTVGIRATANDPDGKIRLADLTSNLGSVVTGGFSNSSVQANASFDAQLNNLPDIPWTGTFSAGINANGSVTFNPPSLHEPSGSALLGSLGSYLFSLGGDMPILGPLSGALNQPLPLIDESVAQLTGLGSKLPSLPSLPDFSKLLSGSLHSSTALAGGTLSWDLRPGTVDQFFHGQAVNLVSWEASNDVSLIDENFTIPIFSLGVPDIASVEADATFGIHASLHYDVGFGLDGHGVWLRAGDSSHPNLGLSFGVTAGVQGQVEVFGFPLAKAGGDIGFAITPYVTLTAPPWPGSDPSKVYLSQLAAFGSNPLTNILDDLSAGIQGAFTGDVYASIDLFLFSVSWNWGVSIPVFNYERSPTWPAPPGSSGGAGTSWPNLTQSGSTLLFNATAAGDNVSLAQDGLGGVVVNWAGQGSEGPFYGISQFVFNGGSGNDTLTASPGFAIPFRAVGGSGGDTFQGGAGNDTLIAGSGTDSITAGSGTDLIMGGSGNDVLVGGMADSSIDSIFGGSGNDQIIVGNGHESIYGGSGVDVITASKGSTGVYSIDGGSGRYTPQNPELIDLSLNTGRGDSIYGGSGGDNRITGSAGGYNLIYGGGPGDTLDGGLGGHDTIYGSAGGFAGAVTNNVVYGGAGGNNLIYGGGAGDVLYGVNVANTVGSQGNPLAEVSGHNTIYGGNGAETLYGGDGQGLQANPLTNGLKAAAGDDRSAGHNLLIAGNGNDVLYGDSIDPNTLQAGAGNDTLYAGLGGDYLVAGQGTDALYGANGPDSLQIPFSPINAQTQLAAAITDTNTTDSITVANTIGIAANRVLQVDHEQMQVTAISGNSLTVTRGINGTTIATHSAAAATLILQPPPQDTLVGGGGADTLVIRPPTSSIPASAAPPTQLLTAIADVNPTDTITVASVANISINTLIEVDSEQMQVTAVSGNSLTVTRGVKGTTAATHAGGAAVLILPQPPEASPGNYRMYFNQVPGTANQYQATLSNLATGNTTSGSNSITGLDSTAQLTVGQPVSGPGIPSGTTITAINSTTSITISNSATASATGVPLVFATIGQLNVTLPTDVKNVALEGGPGDNWIQVDPSVTTNMYLYGGPGHNTLMAGSGSDTLVAGPGTSVLYGGTGDDLLYGGDLPSQDVPPQLSTAGQTSPRANPTAGHDTLIAGAGDSELFAGTGGDVLIGGSVGRAVGPNGTPGLAILQNGQYQLIEGAGRDLLVGGNNPNASDLLIAGPGGPGAFLQGGLGNDVLVADNYGSNMLLAGSGTNLLLGGNLDNVMIGGSGNATLAGGLGSDKLVAGSGNTTLYASYNAAVWVQAEAVAAAAGIHLVPPQLLQGDDLSTKIQVLLVKQASQPLGATDQQSLHDDLFQEFQSLFAQDTALVNQITKLESLLSTLTAAQKQQLESLYNQDILILQERIQVEEYLASYVITPGDATNGPAGGFGTKMLIGISGNNAFYGDLVLPTWMGGNGTFYNYHTGDTISGGLGTDNILMLQGDGAITLSPGANAVDVTIPGQNGGQSWSVGDGVGHMSGIQIIGVQTGNADGDTVKLNFVTNGIPQSLPSGLTGISVQCGSGNNDEIDATGFQENAETLLAGSGSDVIKIAATIATGSAVQGSTTGSTELDIVATTASNTVTVAKGILTINGAPLDSESGNTTAGSNTITGLANTALLAVGQTVTGSVIPPGAIVTSILTKSAITISANVTTTATAVPLVFGINSRKLVVIGGPGQNVFTTDGSIPNVVLKGGDGATNTFNVTGPGSYTIIGGGPVVTAATPATSGVGAPAPVSYTTTSLTEAKAGLAATTAGNNALFAGGVTPTNGSGSSVVDVYNTTARIWSTATLSDARYGLAATTVGNFAVFAGGVDTNGYSGAVDVYNASTGAWSHTALPSDPRAFLSATTVDNWAVFAGGLDASGYSKVVNMYNPATGAWMTTALADARAYLAATTVGSLAIFAGGYDANGDSSAVDIYNNATGAWTTSALSQGRGHLSATTVDNLAIFAGGTLHAGTASNVVDVYIPATGSWSTTALSQPRGYLAAGTIGNTAIFAGGYTSSADPSSVVDTYDVSTGLWSSATPLSEARRSLVEATVGPEVIFAGGVAGSGNGSSTNTVDIYNASDTQAGQFSPLGGQQQEAAATGSAATTVGSKAIFAGGFLSSSGKDSNVASIYDAATGNWSSASLSQARLGLAATTVGGNGLFAGGLSPVGVSGVVDIYNGNTGALSPSPLPLPHPRWGLAATTVGARAFFVGGWSDTGGDAPSNVVDVYDASTQAWSPDTIPQARGAIAAATAGNLAIFVGGVSGHSAPSYSNAVDVYDSSTGAWTHTTVPQAGVYVATTVGHLAIFATGAVAEIFDAATGTWSSATLPQAGVNAATTVGSNAIFVGGLDASGDGNVVDVYNAALGVWSTSILASAHSQTAVTSVGTAALFLGGGTFSDLLLSPPKALIQTPSMPISGLATLNYTLVGASMSGFASIQVQYSVNGGLWQVATAGAGGDGVSNLAATPEGSAHAFIWDTAHDLGNTNNPSVQVRITAMDTIGTGATLTSGSFAVNNSGVTNALNITFNDNANDTVKLAQNGSTVTFSGTAVGTATNLTSVSVTGGSGNNRLDASGMVMPVTLNGGSGSGPDTLIGGAGSDTLYYSGSGSTYDGGGGVDNTLVYQANALDNIAVLGTALVVNGTARNPGSANAIENVLVSGRPASVNNGQQRFWPVDDFPLAITGLSLAVTPGSPAAVLTAILNDAYHPQVNFRTFFPTTVDWGDGTTSTVVGGAGVTASHIYTGPANRRVSVTVQQSDGGAASDSVTYTSGLALSSGSLVISDLNTPPNTFTIDSAAKDPGNAPVQSFLVRNADGIVFSLHTNGDLFAISSSGSLQQADTGVQSIVLGPDGTLYARHTTNGGLYAAASGSSQTHFVEGGVATLVTDSSGNLYKLYTSGLLSAKSPAAGSAWLVVNTNVKSLSLTSDGAAANVVTSDGNDWKFDGSYWARLSGPQLKITLGASATAGQSQAVTVTVVDVLGGTVTSYGGTVHFTSTDPDATLPADYTFTTADAGSHTFSIAFKTSGLQSIAVTDTSNQTIWGRTGVTTEYPLPTPYNQPGSLVSGPDGNLWFTANNGIGRLLPNGTTTLYPVSGSPTVITVGPNGTLWFIEWDTSKIGKITPAANGGAPQIQEFSFSPVISHMTGGITEGPDGNIWFEKGAFIDEMTPAGTIAKEYQVSTSSTVFLTSLAVGPDGNLWFDDGTNWIGTLDLNPATGSVGTVTKYSLPAGSGSPGALVSGPDGALWFLENSPGQLGRITTSGAISTFPLPTGSNPTGLVLGPDQNFWLTDAGLNQVDQITPAGVITQLPAPGPGSQPGAITVGPDGNLWYHVAMGGNMVARLSLTTLPAATVSGSTGVLVKAAVAAQFSVDPPPVQVGSAGQITVTAYDAYGNVVTNYTGTVKLSATDPSAALPTSYAFLSTSLTGNTTSGSNTISGLTSTANLTVGEEVTGSGIPAGTTIASIGTDNSITLSGSATATAAAVALTFGDQGMHTFNPTFAKAGAEKLVAADTAGTGSVGAGNILVNPAPVDLAQSTVAAASTTVGAGGTVAVTMTARDVQGNQETAGGLSVSFGLASGSTGGGNFGPTRDNGDGTYTAIVTAGSLLGNNNLTASILINGTAQPLTSSPASLVVVAGTPSPSRSTVSLSTGSVKAGATDTVTLTAVDAFGNTDGNGWPVAVGLGSGSAGSFSPVTYSGNGTYTAIFTASTAGSNTITATVAGQTVTITPTVTVTPGPVSLAQSAIAAAPGIVPAGGSATLTLTARDAYGNRETSGGLTVAFVLGSGAPLAAQDNGDGTYTATFSAGHTPGSSTITATINGQAVTSAPATVTVPPGPATLVQSTLAVAAAASPAGTTATVMLTARDAYGNQETSGGLQVNFTLGSGSAGGNFSTVSDNGDGTYTTTFTGSAAGGNLINATIGGQALTSAPVAFSVAGGLSGTISSQTPTFVWAPVPGADHYYLWVSDKTTGGIPAVDLPRVTALTLTLPRALAFTPGHSYTWWAGAVSSSGSINWGNGQSFTVAGLAAPTASSPAGPAASLEPTFTWTALPRADHYDIWVADTTAGTSQVLRNTSATGTSWTPAQPLILGHSYTWWAGAVSINGQVTVWSSSQKFTLAPAALTPTGTSGTNLPTFTWAGVTGADHYDVWVDDTTTGTTQVLRNTVASGTSWTADKPLTLGHSYTWWIGAVSAGTTAWSAPQSFAVAPSATSPAGLVNTSTPRFTWAPVTGADHYDVWINDLTTGQNQVLRNSSITGTSWTATAALTSGDSYVWWVGAVSADDQYTGWSSAQTFTLGTGL